MRELGLIGVRNRGFTNFLNRKARLKLLAPDALRRGCP
jgi:hypothetical protein